MDLLVASLHLTLFYFQALGELSRYMIVDGQPEKNRQKLMRNLRVIRPQCYTYTIFIMYCFMSYRHSERLLIKNDFYILYFLIDTHLSFE